MSETAEISTEPQKGETADAFKERITETQRDLKRAEAQAKAKPAEPGAPKAAAQVAPDAATTEKGFLATGNAELDEWLKKKGPMTVENLANSYRESEREMYRKMDEARKAQGSPVTPVAPVPPATFPPYYMAPPVAPAYAPPPAQAPANVEALAEQYGLSPDDFKKVASLANDMARSVVDQRFQQVMPPLFNQVRNVDREVGRQKELVELMADPAFKNPQVQFEMDRVLKEEPSTFTTQAQPIRYAYEKALTRIARANLGGSTTQSATSVSAVMPPQSNPPATAGGNGNGGGGVPQGTQQALTPEAFAGMSMAEKMAHLIAIGVRPAS